MMSRLLVLETLEQETMVSPEGSNWNDIKKKRESFNFNDDKLSYDDLKLMLDKKEIIQNGNTFTIDSPKDGMYFIYKLFFEYPESFGAFRPGIDALGTNEDAFFKLGNENGSPVVIPKYNYPSDEFLNKIQILSMRSINEKTDFAKSYSIFFGCMLGVDSKTLSPKATHQIALPENPKQNNNLDELFTLIKSAGKGDDIKADTINFMEKLKQESVVYSKDKNILQHLSGSIKGFFGKKEAKEIDIVSLPKIEAPKPVITHYTGKLLDLPPIPESPQDKIRKRIREIANSESDRSTNESDAALREAALLTIVETPATKEKMPEIASAVKVLLTNNNKSRLEDFFQNCLSNKFYGESVAKDQGKMYGGLDFSEIEIQPNINEAVSYTLFEKLLASSTIITEQHKEKYKKNIQSGQTLSAYKYTNEEIKQMQFTLAMYVGSNTKAFTSFTTPFPDIDGDMRIVDLGEDNPENNELLMRLETNRFVYALELNADLNKYIFDHLDMLPNAKDRKEVVIQFYKYYSQIRDFHLLYGGEEPVGLLRNYIIALVNHKINPDEPYLFTIEEVDADGSKKQTQLELTSSDYLQSCETQTLEHLAKVKYQEYMIKVKALQKKLLTFKDRGAEGSIKGKLSQTQQKQVDSYLQLLKDEKTGEKSLQSLTEVTSGYNDRRNTFLSLNLTVSDEQVTTAYNNSEEKMKTLGCSTENYMYYSFEVKETMMEMYLLQLEMRELSNTSYMSMEATLKGKKIENKLKKPEEKDKEAIVQSIVLLGKDDSGKWYYKRNEKARKYTDSFTSNPNTSLNHPIKLMLNNDVIAPVENRGAYNDYTREVVDNLNYEDGGISDIHDLSGDGYEATIETMFGWKFQAYKDAGHILKLIKIGNQNCLVDVGPLKKSLGSRASLDRSYYFREGNGKFTQRQKGDMVWFDMDAGKYTINKENADEKGFPRNQELKRDKLSSMGIDRPAIFELSFPSNKPGLKSSESSFKIFRKISYKSKNSDEIKDYYFSQPIREKNANVASAWNFDEEGAKKYIDLMEQNKEKGLFNGSSSTGESMDVNKVGGWALEITPQLKQFVEKNNYEATTIAKRNPVLERCKEKANELKASFGPCLSLLQGAKDGKIPQDLFSRFNTEGGIKQLAGDLESFRIKFTDNGEIHQIIQQFDNYKKNFGAYIDDTEAEIIGLVEQLRNIQDQTKDGGKIDSAIKSLGKLTPNTFEYWLKTDGIILLAVILATIAAMSLSGGLGGMMGVMFTGFNGGVSGTIMNELATYNLREFYKASDPEQLNKKRENITTPAQQGDRKGAIQGRCNQILVTTGASAGIHYLGGRMIMAMRSNSSISGNAIIGIENLVAEGSAGTQSFLKSMFSKGSQKLLQAIQVTKNRTPDFVKKTLSGGKELLSELREEAFSEELIGKILGDNGPYLLQFLGYAKKGMSMNKVDIIGVSGLSFEETVDGVSKMKYNTTPEALLACYKEHSDKYDIVPDPKVVEQMILGSVPFGTIRITHKGKKTVDGKDIVFEFEYTNKSLQERTFASSGGLEDDQVIFNNETKEYIINIRRLEGESSNLDAKIKEVLSKMKSQYLANKIEGNEYQLIGTNEIITITFNEEVVEHQEDNPESLPTMQKSPQLSEAVSVQVNGITLTKESFLAGATPDQATVDAIMSIPDTNGGDRMLVAKWLLEANGFDFSENTISENAEIMDAIWTAHLMKSIVGKYRLLILMGKGGKNKISREQSQRLLERGVCGKKSDQDDQIPGESHSNEQKIPGLDNEEIDHVNSPEMILNLINNLDEGLSSEFINKTGPSTSMKGSSIAKLSKKKSKKQEADLEAGMILGSSSNVELSMDNIKPIEKDLQQVFVKEIISGYYGYDVHNRRFNYQDDGEIPEGIEKHKVATKILTLRNSIIDTHDPYQKTRLLAGLCKKLQFVTTTLDEHKVDLSMIIKQWDQVGHIFEEGFRVFDETNLSPDQKIQIIHDITQKIKQITGSLDNTYLLQQIAWNMGFYGNVSLIDFSKINCEGLFRGYKNGGINFTSKTYNMHLNPGEISANSDTNPKSNESLHLPEIKITDTPLPMIAQNVGMNYTMDPNACQRLALHYRNKNKKLTEDPKYQAITENISGIEDFRDRAIIAIYLLQGYPGMDKIIPETEVNININVEGENWPCVNFKEAIDAIHRITEDEKGAFDEHSVNKYKHKKLIELFGKINPKLKDREKQEMSTVLLKRKVCGSIIDKVVTLIQNSSNGVLSLIASKKLSEDVIRKCLYRVIELGGNTKDLLSHIFGRWIDSEKGLNELQIECTSEHISFYPLGDRSNAAQKIQNILKPCHISTYELYKMILQYKKKQGADNNSMRVLSESFREVNRSLDITFPSPENRIPTEMDKLSKLVKELDETIIKSNQFQKAIIDLLMIIKTHNPELLTQPNFTISLAKLTDVIKSKLKQAESKNLSALDAGPQYYNLLSEILLIFDNKFQISDSFANKLEAIYICSLLGQQLGFGMNTLNNFSQYHSDFNKIDRYTNAQEVLQFLRDGTQIKDSNGNLKSEQMNHYAFINKYYEVVNKEVMMYFTNTDFDTFKLNMCTLLFGGNRTLKEINAEISSLSQFQQKSLIQEMRQLYDGINPVIGKKNNYIMPSNNGYQIPIDVDLFTSRINRVKFSHEGKYFGNNFSLNHLFYCYTKTKTESVINNYMTGFCKEVTKRFDVEIKDPTSTLYKYNTKSINVDYFPTGDIMDRTGIKNSSTYDSGTDGFVVVTSTDNNGNISKKVCLIDRKLPLGRGNEESGCAKGRMKIYSANDIKHYPDKLTPDTVKTKNGKINEYEIALFADNPKNQFIKDGILNKVNLSPQNDKLNELLFEKIITLL